MPPAPKPTRAPKGKKKRQPKSRRQQVKARLVKLVADLVKWRDGYTCVQAETDGGRCWGVPTDGHVIVRDEYGTTFDLLNNHCQCQGHNQWHRFHFIDYENWFIGKFGNGAWIYLKDKARECEGEKSFSTTDLEELAEELQALWDNRPAVHDFTTLCRLGYYGWLLKG